MTNTDIATKIDALIARAAGYDGCPGPSFEIQQYAKAVIADHMVEVIIRDGQVHHFYVEAHYPGPRTLAKTISEVIDAVAA